MGDKSAVAIVTSKNFPTVLGSGSDLYRMMRPAETRITSRVTINAVSKTRKEKIVESRNEKFETHEVSAQSTLKLQKV